MIISPDKDKRVMRFKGVTINSGRVLGNSCLYSAERHKAIPEYSLTTPAMVKQELEKFEEALAQCSAELDTIAHEVAKSVGRAESEIFSTQKHIMNDPKAVGAVRTMVSVDLKNAEWAVSEVLNSYEDRFASLDNQYLRERASDIGEIRRRLLSQMGNTKNGFICEGHAHCERGARRIIVAFELTAEMVVNINLDQVLGFVTEHGGTSSHAAIIARSLGIPAISGIHGVMDFVLCGDKILIDADQGEVYLNPDEATVAELVPVEKVHTDVLCVLGSPPGMMALANASSFEDVKQAAAVGADGIGLFRTEIHFIKEDRLLNEDEQFTYYKQIAFLMEGKPVTYRLLDVGGDKPLSFLRMKKEDNPYLGWRGSRFLLGNPEIFQTQMRALARVSATHPLRILFPMVIDVAQLRELLEWALTACNEVDSNRENITFGIMFEVPSAFLQAEELLSMVDFGSIGSNDLIQYLFAIDRNNELVSQDYNPEHPVLWRMLALLAEASRVTEKPISICGELAGRDGLQSRLLAMGIMQLSVSPRLIPRVRNEMARYAGLLA